jgi:uncharacterized membrane protein YkoI
MFSYSNNHIGFYYLWDCYWRSYRISSEAAIQIALQQVPGQVMKVELDYENGILVYEIDIRTASGVYEVHVHEQEYVLP